jgi:hypothetical protein
VPSVLSPLPTSSRLNPPNRRGTDPYARWRGRGGIARCPPIPITEGCRTTILDHQVQRSVPAAAAPTEPGAAPSEDEVGRATDCAPFMRGFSPPPTTRPGVRPAQMVAGVATRTRTFSSAGIRSKLIFRHFFALPANSGPVVLQPVSGNDRFGICQFLLIELCDELFNGPFKN